MQFSTKTQIHLCTIYVGVSNRLKGQRGCLHGRLVVRRRVGKSPAGVSQGFEKVKMHADLSLQSFRAGLAWPSRVILDNLPSR